ncbi:hypothetical protein B484DRAFT_429547 [Ochromonadaceae sp. CCMP2298]|nr:hypothetical protein B484DRAFT_429547 [Ochromonadaceae sp. CCMP2298]
MKAAAERPAWKGSNEWKGAAWYKDLRGKITNHYLAIRKRDGTRLTNSAPPMTPNDLKFICAELLERNTRHAVSDHALLVWQWQSHVRISEVSNFTCGTLSIKNTEYISGCIRTTMPRAKTTEEHDTYVCLHAKDFEVCPFHALGASVILNCVVDRLFPIVTEGAESSHTNDVLREAGRALSGSITPVADQRLVNW